MSNMNSRMIVRDHLMCLLDGVSVKGVIFLHAPAGYGKTVFARQWLERNSQPYAYIALDEYDNDPVQLCTSFCMALLNSQPGNESLRKMITHPSFDIAPDEFAFRAIAELSHDESVLAIDDLHCVYNGRTLQMLLTFLAKLPDGFTIILISRDGLPLGYSDLHRNGAFMKIAADELRFNNEEIVQLYEQRGYSITPEMADEICRLTDGWAIGVGALLLSGGNPHGESLTYLEGFIRANVWERWDEADREFMLKTAVVRELTPSLCAAVTGESNCEKRLEQLIHQNVFISRTEQGAYRYHGLFHDFLRNMQKQRGDAFCRELLDRAGNWYLTKHDFYNATDCFIKSENHDGIIQCFMLLINIGHQDFIIEKLLPIINSSMIGIVAELCPYIYSLLGWAAFNQGRAEDFTYYCDQYYKHHIHIAKTEPRLTLNIVFARMTDFRNNLCELFPVLLYELPALIAAHPTTLEIKAGTINQNMPFLHRGTRDLSEFAGIAGFQTTGIDRSSKTCTSSVAENGVEAFAVSARRRHMFSAFGIDVGRLVEMLGAAFGEEASLFVECAQAGLLYEQGRLEEAFGYASAAHAKMKKHFSSESKFFTMAILGLTLEALGRFEQSAEVLSNIADMIEQDRAYGLSQNFRALSIRQKLREGEPKAAESWLKEHEPSTHDSLDFYKLYIHMTTCRALLIKGDYDSAIILLKKVLTLVTAYNRPLDRIEAHILLSVAYWNKKKGFRSEAKQYLKQAVSVAYGYGYTQLFINEGAVLAELLKQLQSRDQWQSGEIAPPAEFIETLYIKTPERPTYDVADGQPAAYTEKQQMVMKLLCEGKSYNEIAQIMEVRISTLRSHIAVIYRKLDVMNETEAVAKIKAQGILSVDR